MPNANDKEATIEAIPVIPLRDIVVFPHTTVPLFVGRDRSIRALEEAMLKRKEAFFVAQRDAQSSAPDQGELHELGTLGRIVNLLRLPDGTMKVLVQGQQRARLRTLEQGESFSCAEIALAQDPSTKVADTQALVSSVQSAFQAYAKLGKRLAADTVKTVRESQDCGRVSDIVATHLATLKLEDKQSLIEMVDSIERLQKVSHFLHKEMDILQVERRIRSRVKKQMERTQREYYLNEQMQAIQRELGDRDEFKGELQELEEGLAAKSLSNDAQDRVRKELRKLKLMQPISAEATVVRAYLSWILNLPWSEYSEEKHDIAHAHSVLDADHHGLMRVKDRILEHLAVLARVQKLDGPVLCLVGPPGVGKTSLARSIAAATGREFVRFSLGGVRDEAEIRGHRRTYVGALPGRILQGMRKAGTSNPLFLLDEIDKMSADFRGDPASALLEVLDPEQNSKFSDHYLELDYDLSRVMFVTTANSLSGIPLPLQDRMEVIELNGYTEYEKVQIAKRYLIPRRRRQAGLDDIEIDITDNAVRAIIQHYTREAGVRGLEREIGGIFRKIARRVLEEPEQKKFHVPTKTVPRYLGVPKYQVNKANDHDEIGLTTGLAYTSFGGSTLDCEVTAVAGKGKLVITGLLEKGMQESAQAALSYIRSRQAPLGLASDFHQNMDIHVHFPEFVPKDGPSAGITMATSIASALMKVPVRRQVAMTGEITLRGRVLPIGGLNEKLVAAHRASLETVLIPRDNRKDLRDIPKRVLQAMRIVLVEHMDEVLREALALDNPDALFGSQPPPMEYRHGRKFDPCLESQELPRAIDLPAAKRAR